GRQGPLVVDGELDRGVLAHVSALKLNEREAVELCGGTGEEALRTLGIQEGILTLGSDGALILSGDEAGRVGGAPGEGGAGPTGAGDSSLLAYGHARDRGADAREAGEAASRFVAEIIRS